MTTASNTAFQAYRRKITEMLDAYYWVVSAEFQSGQKVEWAHTYKWDHKAGTSTPVMRQGVVSSVSDNGRVNIRVKPDGPLHAIEGYLLEIIK